MSRGGGQRELRIIGGRWRSRRLGFLDRPGLRPTPDRVRETLFNWLQFELAGRHVLDLFAGSGAMAFEALSRGAGSATLIERDAGQAACLREMSQRLGAEQCEIVCADSLRWLRTATPPADGCGLILLDPPFHQQLPDQALALLASGGWLRPGTWVYVETEQAPETLQRPAGLLPYRETRAGLVHALLFRCEPDEDERDRS